MKEITLTKNKIAIVDDEDYGVLSKRKWHFSTRYPKTTICTLIDGVKKYRSVCMHVIIMNPPKGMVVDHIDRNPLNNCRSNLRICTQRENLQNRSLPLESVGWKNRISSSKYRGVYITRNSRKYITKSGEHKSYGAEVSIRAQIRVNGKQKYLGSFGSEIEAAKAYNAAALEFHGQNAILNTI